MLERLHHLAKEKVDFAFETTLASRTFASWIDGLRQTGYDCHIVFLWLPSPEFAIARVQERVRMGGHNVPVDIIRRRYKAGIRNFFNLYQPLTESWRFYDNSDPAGPRVIAAGRGKDIQIVEDKKIWNMIKEAANNEKRL